MDDTPCRDFFRHPTSSPHRQYEALRAAFVDRQPLPDVAQQFGYRYGSLRNLVADFRARCHAGQAPPFSPPRPAGGHPVPGSSRKPLRRSGRPPPTAGTSA